MRRWSGFCTRRCLSQRRIASTARLGGDPSRAAPAGRDAALLWEEHRGIHPDGYDYSRYCELYRAWEGRLSPTMRQQHVAGERMFVDYAGTTLEVVDGATGEVRVCQLFVAVLGASNYTYAEATFTQRLVDWIGSHGTYLHVLQRRHSADRFRQLEVGRYEGVLLRAGGEPHICRDGASLRHRSSSGPSAAPEG
jgi:hypothetical protein